MAQSLARLWTHLIFSTKERYPFLSDPTVRVDMHGYLAKVLRTHDCQTLEVGGCDDHVHALFALSRNHSIAQIVKEIKRTSSSVYFSGSMRSNMTSVTSGIKGPIWQVNKAEGVCQIQPRATPWVWRTVSEQLTLKAFAN